jgi:hypothetical protein
MHHLTGGASVPDRGSADILAALNAVADACNVDPAAIASVIHTESVWDTRCVTGSYIGLTQVGPDFIASLHLTRDQFLGLSAAAQIQDYARWLAFYSYTQQVAQYGMNVAGQPAARQAAVLQAMQFSPNGSKWKVAFASGDYSVPSTPYPQARFLGDTSIHDMEAYYTGFFKQHPPSYADAAPAAVAVAPLQPAPAPPVGVAPAVVAGLAPLVANFAAAAGGPAPKPDGQSLPTLIKIASDPAQLVGAQHIAAKRLLDFDGEVFPSDGCAITLSVLLQEAGIPVANTYPALAMGNVLKGRGWQVVPIGSQQAGDVGSTCGPTPHHGYDHIYLVLRLVNSDEMVVADNQAEAPHFRWASGKGGKTPTTFFLRAPT